MRQVNFSKFLLAVIVVLAVLFVITLLLLRDLLDENENVQDATSISKYSSKEAGGKSLTLGDTATPIVSKGGKNEAKPSVAARFSDETELCKNFATDKLIKSDPFQFFDALQSYLHASDHTVEAWLRDVANNGLPRQRGAALSLLLAIDVRAAQKLIFDKNSNCDQSNQCAETLRTALLEKTNPDLTTLLQLAIYTSDPKLYGMAYNACHSGPFYATNLCARLGAAHWLQRDPDNGAPAMYVLEEMKMPTSSDDATALENALYRLSLAKQFDHYLDIVDELPPLPTDISDYQHRTELAALAYEHVIMMPIPPRKNILTACNEEAVKQPQRRLTCITIANQLLRDNASLFDRAAFMQLSRHLDWDKEKLQRITDDFDLARAYFREIMRREAQQVQQSPGRTTACHMNLKQMDRTLKNLKSGEFAMYLEDAKTFDIPREELIKMGRRLRAPK